MQKSSLEDEKENNNSNLINGKFSNLSHSFRIFFYDFLLIAKKFNTRVVRQKLLVLIRSQCT